MSKFIKVRFHVDKFIKYELGISINSINIDKTYETRFFINVLRNKKLVRFKKCGCCTLLLYKNNLL